jgi:purine-nucleoside phosphorylase
MYEAFVWSTPTSSIFFRGPAMPACRSAGKGAELTRRGIGAMSGSVTRQAIIQAMDYVRARAHYTPHIGMVLGSGLNAVAERITEPDVIPYSDIPHFPRPAVAGHVGRLLLGRMGNAQVMAMQGRSHYYEGYSVAETTLPIRVMQLFGIQTLIVTNAAGGIRPGLRAGDLMAIVDHLNLVGIAGHSPLRGPNDETLGPRFPDMTRAYDAELLDLLRAEARAQGIPLHEGIYVMVAGPSFETPAEIRFLRAIGADAVGMSTVPEVVVARHGGMRVLGISLISNVAKVTFTSANDVQAGASHEEVLDAGSRTFPILAALLEGLLRRLA